MRIQPKELFFSTNGEPVSKFNRVVNQYDDFINGLLREKRAWQLVGLIALACIIGTILGWFYVLSVREQIPVVIEVNELGRARYVGDINQKSYRQGYTVKEYMVEAVVRDFIDYSRSIYVDGEVVRRNLQQASMWLSDELKVRFYEEITAEDPLSRIGQIRRRVEIESSLRETGMTWQFDWFDITNDLYGREMSRVRMRGLFTVAVKEPETENERYFNPLGIYIVGYSVTKISEVMR